MSKSVNEIITTERRTARHDLLPSDHHDLQLPVTSQQTQKTSKKKDTRTDMPLKILERVKHRVKSPYRGDGLSSPQFSNNPNSAPNIWAAAMGKSLFPMDDADMIKKDPNLKKLSLLMGHEGWLDSELQSKLSKTTEIQALIEEAMKRRQGVDEVTGRVSQKKPTFDNVDYVNITDDGYIIYKIKDTHDYGVAGVRPIYRIKRIDPSESMKALKSGANLCMCRALGTCPLLAYSHQAPCPFCTDPTIIRYYPTDSDWWNVRDKVKQMRQTVVTGSHNIVSNS